MESLQLSYELDRLVDIVEERKRLVTVLKIEPSNNDNVNLKKQLNKVLDSLNEANENSFEELEEYAKNYNDILTDIPDEAVDIKLYQFQIPQRKAAPITITDGSSITSANSTFRDTTKKVRFRDDNLVSYEEDPNQNFVPYKDEPDQPSGNENANIDDIEQERQKLFDSSNALEQTTSVISPQVSNQDLFIQQQQQLLEQDSQLERLSGSIRTTHGISLSINDEVNEQNDQVLHDLESLLDNGGRNLDRAKRRLKSFERSARENGPCFTIVVLILILILLLAVL
ncbi:hypothetical protein ZYGR_0N02320 [Zygosaccharomyces rouxii]|uniref:ZYRO0D05632p n=2 Tax=Zygosaccharomyces rouxii TaxID=4956 RepID=C5DVC7_ZYGRC|nr:uncharacterized protein ZYRO0D05632g [Zygosaccharomyces rouxii]KAH9200659.1 hypothetical protein LQ764DRAFT_97419 [Zygosaccharomyces rouxii]GAV48827.1 hypothetical protein ZYGR_0N02320 [Zygosaccharomyces rouxii]CAR27746.1 ZYRO0D05632p [Zygosaccharomyces rouxii]